MRRTIAPLIAAVIATALWFSLAHVRVVGAAPNSAIWNSVSVCNPDFPDRCIAPDAGGGITATISSITGNVGINSGANYIGQVGLVSVIAGGTFTNVAVTTVSSNCAVVKSSAGTLYGVTASTTNTNTNYIKYYNTNTTPQTTNTAVSLNFAIAGNTSGTGLTNPIPTVGIAFTTGIGRCVVGGYTITDNTSAVGGIVINEMYR